MFLYFFIILFFLIIGSKKLALNNHSLYYYGSRSETTIFFLTALFLCGGYMTGSDWRSYESLYLSANWNNFKYFADEQLFYILMIYSKEVVPNFFIFLIISKLVVLYTYWIFFKNYSTNKFWSLFFFIPMFGLFLFIDNPLRFMISLGFITVSYKYLINSNFWIFLGLVVLGSLFHITALIFLPFYFLRNININKKVLVILFLSWTFLFTSDSLLFFINIVGDFIPMIKMRYSNYITSASEIEKIFSLGSIINIIFFTWIVINKERIEDNLDHGKLFFSMAIVYLFSTKLGVIFPTGFRFTYFFAPFFVLTLTYLLQISNYRFQKLFSTGIILYIALFTYKKIDNHYVYLPYSNYFLSILEGTPKPYTYRDQYNKQYFKDRKGYSYDQNE